MERVSVYLSEQVVGQSYERVVPLVVVVVDLVRVPKKDSSQHHQKCLSRNRR